MINDILTKKKYYLIVAPIILLLIIAMTITSNISEDTNNNEDTSKVSYKTDKEPVITRFPMFGEVESCFWKADTIGRYGIGPTPYWMKGFAILRKSDFEKIKDDHSWEAMDTDWKPELDTNVLKLNSFRWYESENFRPEGNLAGRFYLDFENMVVYFDVER